MKTRRHHNNKGRQMVKSGNAEKTLRILAQELGIPYGKLKEEEDEKVSRQAHNFQS